MTVSLKWGMMHVEYTFGDRLAISLDKMHLVMFKRQHLELGRECWTGDECGSGCQKIYKAIKLDEVIQRVGVDRKQ